MKFVEHNFNSKSILVVDDEEMNYLLVKDILEGVGANLTWARVGLEAIDLVNEGRHYDIVLMDMKMPLMDGYQTTRELKKIQPSLQIVALTAFTMDDDEAKCLAAGCNAYLSKPVSMDELLGKMNSFFEQQTGSENG